MIRRRWRRVLPGCSSGSRTCMLKDSIRRSSAPCASEVCNSNRGVGSNDGIWPIVKVLLPLFLGLATIAFAVIKQREATTKERESIPRRQPTESGSSLIQYLSGVVVCISLISTNLVWRLPDTKLRSVLLLILNSAFALGVFALGVTFIPISTGVSSVEIKPATNGRNDPASGSWIRCCEDRSIFLSNKPDSNHLRRVWLEEKCGLTQIVVAGSFRPLLAGLK
jgi:hypothetical protein